MVGRLVLSSSRRYGVMGRFGPRCLLVELSLLVLLLCALRLCGCEIERSGTAVRHSERVCKSGVRHSSL